MKEIKILFLLCLCLKFSKSAENDTCDCLGFEKNNLDLNLENTELRLNMSNIAHEFAKLQKEHFETRQKLNKVASHYATLNSNCSVLTDQITTLVDSLQTLTENIEPLKQKSYSIDLPKNCDQASREKINTIAIPFSNLDPFDVVCETEIHEGNWLVIQRRMDGSVDFHRPWLEYKKGFGTLDGEFFIGLDKLHTLTSYVPHELVIVMKDFNDETKFRKYSDFEIGSEHELYDLKKLGESSGTATDSLTQHVGRKFSTYDNDNDNDGGNNCAKHLLGGWWYYQCPKRENSGYNSQTYKLSNLNGLYLNGSYTSDYKYGVTWDGFYQDYYSLKFVQMMIKPKKHYNH